MSIFNRIVREALEVLNAKLVQKDISDLQKLLGDVNHARVLSEAETSPSLVIIMMVYWSAYVNLVNIWFLFYNRFFSNTGSDLIFN